jgi:hypothetical protein
MPAATTRYQSPVAQHKVGTDSSTGNWVCEGFYLAKAVFRKPVRNEPHNSLSDKSFEVSAMRRASAQIGISSGEPIRPCTRESVRPESERSTGLSTRNSSCFSQEIHSQFIHSCLKSTTRSLATGFTSPTAPSRTFFAFPSAKPVTVSLHEPSNFSRHAASGAVVGSVSPSSSTPPHRPPRLRRYLSLARLMRIRRMASAAARRRCLGMLH